MHRVIMGGLFVLATGGDLRAQGRAFTPADWYRLTTLSAPAVSPDGKWVAVTVTTVREADNKRHQEVWMVGVDGGEPTRLTSPSLESSNPRWSADGKLLLFLSTRPNSKARTWALWMDRPAGEAFELDSLPRGVVTADGRWLVYADTSLAPPRDTTAKDRFARMPPMARPPYGAITKPLDPARFDGRHVTEMVYKANAGGFLPGLKEPRRWNPAQIWVRDLVQGGKRAVTQSAYSHRDVAVSPDGRLIAFVANAELRSDSAMYVTQDSLSRAPYDKRSSELPRNDADVFVIPIDGGTPRAMTSVAGTEGDLQWSPDGTRIAYMSRPTRTGPLGIFVVSTRGSAPENLLANWQYEPTWFQWLPNGTMLMSAPIGGRNAIFSLDPNTKALKELVGGRRRLAGIATNPAGGVLAYVATSMTKPTELYLARGNGSGERQVTRFNAALNAEIAWPDAERFTYKSVGGLEIEAWLVKPYGYQVGKEYPLVLYIHGGPHGAYGENWFDEFHNLAGAGMWVLYANPRGSSGYGAAFTYSIRGRLGDEDYQDLMKAVDIAAARTDVDSTRMGVTGGSYGGFMTAWVTTRTARFKAAQTDRMISNWWSWYGTSDVQRLTEFELYGKPWENPTLYDALSPIRFVSRVTTPTLIVQSEEDHRTPMADAEQWFMALQKRNIPVEFVRYPRSNHDLSRTGEPWLLVDRLGRLRQWFVHWLEAVEPQASSQTR